MAKKEDKSRQRPDEVFSAGPLTIARYGPNIIWQADWKDYDFQKNQNRLAELHPQIVRDIDALVSDIAILIASLSPRALLHRAWGEMAIQHLNMETESDVDDNAAVAMRMLDYVQSVISAVPPNDCQRDNISEDDWQLLQEKIRELFDRINTSYQISRTARNMREDPHFDHDVEEFHFKAQMYWCNVRGKRYQIHEPEYLRTMFIPHSDVLTELFGISGEAFVDEILKIWHALSFGLEDAYNALDQFRKDVLDEFERTLEDRETGEHLDIGEIMREVIAAKGWEARRDDVFGRCFGTDLFDLEKVTALPTPLLDELSWSPGEDKEFFAPGDFCGWPLRIWPAFRRPFLRLDEKYYCFNLYILFDHIYRVMQRIILRRKPDYAEAWNSIQRSISEALPLDYIGRILPGARRLNGIFYRGITDIGTTAWCEVDGLLVYDDHLFVIESRAGAFTYTPPATDFPAWVESLKNLVHKPATQGKRFVEYMKSAEVVGLYNEHHQRVDEIRYADFRHVTICAVTLDPFTEIAAQVQHLRKMGLNVGVEPVWSISVDDLLVYADVFENPLLFLHFVEQRTRAFQSDELKMDDELDHFGLYLQYNHYARYAEEIHRASGAELGFLGYRSDLDRFFAARLRDENIPSPLTQDIPVRIREIVEVLSRTSESGRAQIAGFLLDLDGTWRDRVANEIEEELVRQSISKRFRPFSMHGQMNLTVVCNTPELTEFDEAKVLDHGRTVAVLNGDEDRLVLILNYTNSRELREVRWKWVNVADIAERQLGRLEDKAEGLRRSRVAKARSERKIGRNEQCPCGSGKKYKRCCLKLQRK